MKLVRSRGKKEQWHANWQDRLDAIVRHGLPVKLRRTTIDDDGFISVGLEIDELILPRSHRMRGFHAHLTLGFRSDYGAGIAEAAVERINQRWQGEWMLIRVKRYTSGGTVELSADDMLYRDDDIYWLHSRGWYGARRLHISL